MPFARCRNFEDNGSRKTWPDGTEMRCRPTCGFVHPSDPDWDRAPRAAVRGRGGPPQGGRGRRQSSFGHSAPGGSSSTQGPEWGSSSGAWEDYMTGFNPTPRATSSARGTSHRSQATSRASGWGSSGADGPGWGNSGADGAGWGNSGADNPGWGNSGADGPGWGSSGAGDSGWGSSGADDRGWGSNANINGNPSDGPSNEPGTSGEQATSSQCDTQAVEWGSSGNGWGSAGADLGSGWGEASIPNQGDKASSATTVANPDAWGGTGADDNPDAAIAMTLPSRAIPSISTSSELIATHNEERGEDTPPLDIPLAAKSIKMRPPHNYDNYDISTLSGTDKMGILTAMTLKMRELDAELSHLSALRKSRLVVAARAAKELLQSEVHKFIDARAAVEAEHNFFSGYLTQSDLLCLSNIHHTLATLGRDNEQLEQFKDWVSRAETCSSHAQPESGPDPPIERSDGGKSDTATLGSKLNQLRGRSESLAEAIYQCQGQQFYNALDSQIQDRRNPIVAAIVKSQDMTHNHLVSTSLFPLQRQGELWHQTLQIQAGKFAQALLQSDQLKKDKRNQSSLKKEKGAIQQNDIVQKRLQLQALQEEMAQLHNILSTKQSVIDTSDEYASEYIQRYIQAKATLIFKAELSKAAVHFTVTELKTVEKVWKALQLFTQIPIWLQHSDIYKTEEEMEIREIESLLA